MDLDLKLFYETVKDDKIMEGLTRKLWGLKSPTTPTAFEALVDSIVEQQISLKVANSIEVKIIKKFGENLGLRRRRLLCISDAATLSYRQHRGTAPVRSEFSKR